MLSYNFDALNNKCYSKCAYQEYHNISELFASILAKGINKTVFTQEQLMQGRTQSYKQTTVPSVNNRGIVQSINPRPRLHSGHSSTMDNYDELTLDTPINQVFKATLTLLLDKLNASKSTNKVVRREIKSTLLNLNNVTLSTKKYNNTNSLLTLISKLDNHRTPKSYKLLLTISNLAILSTTSNLNSNTSLLHPFDEDSICVMFKQFMIEYYRKHYKLYKILPPIVRWNAKHGETLPPIRADLIISNYYNNSDKNTGYISKSFTTNRPEKKLVVLTRYNTDIQDPIQQDSPMLNDFYKLNAMLTMLKELSSPETKCNISGLLIYVTIEKDNDLDNLDNQVYRKEYALCKDKILVNSLNLNNNFQDLTKQLDNIISVLN